MQILLSQCLSLFFFFTPTKSGLCNVTNSASIKLLRVFDNIPGCFQKRAGNLNTECLCRRPYTQGCVAFFEIIFLDFNFFIYLHFHTIRLQEKNMIRQ